MSSKSTLLVLIPISLSAYTHLWNASGFPDIFYDEGAYLRRAMHILYFQNPQESETYYDHPYFGQILLAGMFAVTGFPDSVEPAPTVQSIETLFLVPKLWIGLCSVIDTYLIYKIVQHRYKDQRIAIFAALLFAVMPISWITRRILLEALLLPFLLTSILFALQVANTRGSKHHLLLLMSGVFAGLAIFTKLPAFAAMPLIGYIIYSASSCSRSRTIGLWLIPVVLMPILWPLYSISEGHFDYWLASMSSQTQRNSDGIATIFSNFWKIDPVLLVLGTIGIAYCAVIKKDIFPVLWAAPFMALFSSIAYVQYFHVIPILPVFSVATALWLVDLVRRIGHARSKLFENAAVAALTIFGLVITTLIISTDMTSSQYEAATLVLWIADQDTTIISNPAYSWIYNFVLHMPYSLTDYRDVLYSPIPTTKVILISEPHFEANMAESALLGELYNRTSSVQTFYGDVKKYDIGSYPYSSLAVTSQGEFIDVRRYPAP